MPRTNLPRQTFGITLNPKDVTALNALADEAGVKRADVVRLAVEVLLRGLDRKPVLAILAARGRESTEPLTETQWALLRG